MSFRILVRELQGGILKIPPRAEDLRLTPIFNLTPQRELFLKFRSYSG